MALILFFAFSLFLQGALGGFVCEQLPVGMCSFAVASSGKRCLLETSESSDGTIAYQCKSSEVVVKNMPEWVENNECVSACGIDRYSVGISSDSLLEPEFAARLCSPACYQNCPNIVDLYYSLALAEGGDLPSNFYHQHQHFSSCVTSAGVFLPDLCKAQQTNPRRAMAELLSSGAASGPVSAASGPASAEAAGPMSSESSASLACAPASI